MPTKTSYDAFKESPPGKRFQALREWRTRSCEAGRPAVMAGGALLCAVGVVLLILPGPGILVILVGLALIAQESTVVARGLDYLELLGRKSWLKLRRLFTTG